MTQLPIQLLPHGLAIPEAATAGAAGFDLAAALPEGEDWEIAPNERALIPTGLALAIPTGMVGLVCSRSGLALKQGVCVLNAPGIIDSDYRGEVGVVLINHGDKTARIARGDRIAQLVIMSCPKIKFEPTDLLPKGPEDERGARETKGFGSTGLGNAIS